MANLFELKEKLAELTAAINADCDWIAEKAADPSTKMEEITGKEEHLADLEKRFALIQKQHDDLEAKQKEAVKRQVKDNVELDDAQMLIKGKADFYRSALSGDTVKVYEGLGAIPQNSADLGFGENLLPTNMTT